MPDRTQFQLKISHIDIFDKQKHVQELVKGGGGVLNDSIAWLTHKLNDQQVYLNSNSVPSKKSTQEAPFL